MIILYGALPLGGHSSLYLAIRSFYGVNFPNGEGHGFGLLNTQTNTVPYGFGRSDGSGRGIYEEDYL